MRFFRWMMRGVTALALLVALPGSALAFGFLGPSAKPFFSPAPGFVQPQKSRLFFLPSSAVRGANGRTFHYYLIKPSFLEREPPIEQEERPIKQSLPR
ncbi:MAG: hypothetical protein H6707_06925 [Deltaproteobacteria bacterium]|nr:hypothetical protein [Deltaproteobacteria bacterium]